MAVAGVYIIIEWREHRWCSVFLITRADDDDDYFNSRNDFCAEKVWAVVSFVDAALFAGSAYCLFVFSTFRMDKLVAKNAAAHDEDAVEMRDVVMAVPCVSHLNVETAVSIGHPIPAPMGVYVPQTSEKLDV